MADEAAANYIRAFRRKFKLSQEELGILVGYPSGDSVGKHERSETAPPLLLALAYEVVLDVPVGQLFAGFRAVVAQAVVRNAEELRARLEKDCGGHESDSELSQWLVALKQRTESTTNHTQRRYS